jgi:hypothetical protein
METLMATNTHAPAAPLFTESYQPGADWFSALAQAVMQAQRMQLALFEAWQRSLAATQQELWDEWIAHWAGGAPIDA